MSRFTNAMRSSIGRKLVLALTGLGLLGFVIAHMVGNLQILIGGDHAQEKLNNYAHMLQSLGAVLWAMRIGLLAMFVVHVKTAIELWRENQTARGPDKYAVASYNTSTFASRTMILSGFTVLAFVVYHLLHFTFGVVDGSHSAHNLAPYQLASGDLVPDIYSMVILSFRLPVIAISYIVANVLLAMHISHGASSVIQTLGFTSPRISPLKSLLGPGLGAVIAVGNCSIPSAILTGLVGKGVQ